MQNSKKNSKVIAALITGVAIGATLSILYAPRSGKETRTRIKDTTVKTSRKLNSETLKLKERILDGIEESGDGLGYSIGTTIARIILTSKDILKALEKELQALKPQDYN